MPIRQKHIQQGKQKYLQETKLPEGKPQLSSVAKPWRQKLGEIQIEKQQRVWVALFCFKSELLKLKKYHHNERKPKELFGQNFTFHSCYINPPVYTNTHCDEAMHLQNIFHKLKLSIHKPRQRNMLVTHKESPTESLNNSNNRISGKLAMKSYFAREFAPMNKQNRLNRKEMLQQSSLLISLLTKWESKKEAMVSETICCVGKRKS